MSIKGKAMVIMALIFNLTLPIVGGRYLGLRFGQDDSGEIPKLIGRLHLTDSKERELAKEKLLVLASEEGKKRDQIVFALIKVLEATDNEDYNVNPQTWYDGAEILGKLRATEAIDVLVKHLDYSDGVVGLSLAHFPAVQALVRIGDQAVPKLVEALFQAKTDVRVNAALALGLIGSIVAKEALERALLTESEEEVITMIKIQLATLARKSKDG